MKRFFQIINSNRHKNTIYSNSFSKKDDVISDNCRLIYTLVEYTTKAIRQNFFLGASLPRKNDAEGPGCPLQSFAWHFDYPSATLRGNPRNPT